MSTIRKLISAWVLPLAGSFILQMVSVAAVSGTTCDAPYTTTTTSSTIAEHTAVVDSVELVGTSLQSTASGHSWSLLAQKRILDAPNNTIPSNVRFSRTVSADVAEGIQSGRFTTLGRMGADDVFITASDDIAGLSRGATANRLTIPQSDAAFRLDFTLPNANGVASPVFRSNPGFIQGGRAAGGAREFVMPNLPLDSLNYTISPIQ